MTRKAVVWVIAMLAATGCASSEPPAARSPREVIPDGARWVVRDNYPNGTAAVVTFELRGDSVRRTTWVNFGPNPGVVADDTYDVKDNQFYMPQAERWCYQIVSTPDCGLLATITADAVYFTRMANGKRSRDQESRVGEDLTPVKRQR